MGAMTAFMKDNGSMRHFPSGGRAHNGISSRSPRHLRPRQTAGNGGHNAPQSKRERYKNLLLLPSLDENMQTGPLWQKTGYQEAQKELTNLHKSKKWKSKFLKSPVRDRRRLHDRLDPSLQEYLEWLSIHMGGRICRTAKFRTPTTTTIFKLVTKPNMVEFFSMYSTHTGKQDDKWSDTW